MSRSAFWGRVGLVLAVAALVPACGRSRSRGGLVSSAPAVLVVLTGPASTSETGSTTTFTVALSTLPAADVVIDISSSNTDEGTVSLSQLTFTSANGTTAQTVTVTGEDDPDLDGNVAYTIVIDPAVSTDATYSGMDAADLNLVNNDDEVVGISVTPTDVGDILEGATAQFTVELTAPPTADVTVPITVTTGVGDVLVSGPGSGGQQTTFDLVLTAAQMSRTVTVHAVDDGTIEATEAFTIQTGDPTSTDAGYEALGAADVADVIGNVLDNDSASIVVEPTTAPGGVTLLTSELGHTDTFRVRLGSGLSAGGEVTVTITGLDLNEGSLSTTTVVFDDTNAQTFQTVTVTGLDDPVTPDTADVEYSLTLTAANTGGNAADNGFIGLTATVVVTNVDTEGLTMPPGGTGQTAPTAAPGIPLGGSGAFHEHEATDPTVIQRPGPVFEMWFRGRSQSGIKNDAIGYSSTGTVPPASGWSGAVQVLSGNSGIDWIRRGVGRPSVLYHDFDNNNGGTPDTYLMFYSGRFAGDYDGIAATSSSFATFGFGISGGPDFAASGVAGNFDELRVTDPCVIYDNAGGGTFHMWYTGVDANGVEQIGYATAPRSGNGPGAWVAQNTVTPALGLGATGRFDADGVSQPAVVFDGTTYHLFYTANDALRGRTTIGYAGSTNPADFSAGRFPLPVVVPDSTGTATWSDQNVFSPAVVKDGALYRIWYSGTGSGGRGIGYVEGN